MTEFESSSLKISTEALNAGYWQMWAMIASAVISLVGAAIAIWTLRQLVQQVRAGVEANSINQLNALLLLEQDMSRRRDRLGEVTVELSRVQNSSAYHSNPSILDPVIKQYNESEENYLNSLDRLCFCILRNKFSEDELRAEYRDVLKLAQQNSPAKFGPASDFRNIIKLHDKWAAS